MQLKAHDVQSWPAARNNSIIATKLVYPLCRNTFLPARAFQTSAEGLGRAGTGAGAGAGAGVVDTRGGDEEGRCSARRSCKRCTDDSRLLAKLRPAC